MVNTHEPRIIHVDLNSCFATVAQQAYRTLRGKPLVVAAYETPRAIILAPSIESKRYGIKTGMSVEEARMLCPSIIVRQPDVGMIRDVHIKFEKICRNFSPDVRPKSIDEFVVDCTSLKHITTRDMVAIGREIKKRLLQEVGEWMRCNVGIATNRFLAKVAAGLHKPDGLDVMTHINLLHILASLTLIDLPGINVRYQARLNMHGIFTPLDFYHASLLTLKRGVFQSIIGYHWFLRLRGWEVDSVDFQRKTYGQQYSLGKKTNNPRELSRLLLKLCEKMGRRLRRKGYISRGIHVGCMQTDGTYWHKGRKTNRALYTTADLYKEAQYVLNQRPPEPVVSQISVHCYDIEKPVGSQATLFDIEQKQERVSKALDAINDRYGEFTVSPALIMHMENLVLDRIAFGRGGLPSEVQAGVLESNDS